MADRKQHRRVLTPARAALVVAVIVAVLSPTDARAHNVWEGGYRKWPWKASAVRTLTTLPGECPHCPAKQSSSAWKAIDVGDMDYETVYAIAPGTVDGVDTTGSSGAGIYIRIKDLDGTYVTYEHLESVTVASGATIVAGQPIGVSGNTGNSTGPHLHFQRQSGQSFSSTALDLALISGHGGSGDPLQHISYGSDNAGIGYASNGNGNGPIRAAYQNLGGYRWVGVTANIGEVWSPCRDDAIYGTWWRYRCAADSYAGSVQTFYDEGRERALLVADGSNTAYTLARGILAAYTELWNGRDWVHHIGYPTGNRYVESTGVYRQQFQNGFIRMRPAECEERVYMGNTLRAYYYFCD